MTDGIEFVPPDLLKFMSMEEHQVFASLARMKGELAAIADVQSLYEAAISNRSAKPDDYVVFQLLTFTHYHFLFALACHFRCHLSEAFAAARAAIDAALIAAVIIKDRALQTAYAKREKPFDKLNQYLGGLIKDGATLPHPHIPELRRQQSLISTFAVHADVGSFVHRIDRSVTDDRTVMSVQYFQFSTNEHQRSIHTFTLLHTFVMVLDIFTEFLVTEQKAVPPAWKERLQQIGAGLERHARQLREKLRENEERADKSGVTAASTSAPPTTE